MATHELSKIAITEGLQYILTVSNLVIKDGNEGIGKVLVSDSSGLTSWKHPATLMGAFEHYIGELYGGGIVFDVWREGDDEKVLIASLTDSGPTIWGSNSILTGATSISNGKSNTEKVQTTGAVKFCREYRKFSTPLSYTFSSISTAGDPGSGFFRYLTMTGFIYINNLDATNNDRSSVIDKWEFMHQAGTQMGKIIVKDQLTGSKIGYCTVLVSSNNPNPIVQNAGYLRIETSYYIGSLPVDNRRYTLTFEYGKQGDVEYDDWYLPSSSEMNKLLDSAFTINRILGDKNGINATSNYWTSTEYNLSNAYVVSGTLANATGQKNANNLVRPIRLAETKKSGSIALDLDITNVAKIATSPTRIQESTLLQNGVSQAIDSYLTFSNGVIYNYDSESGYVTFDGTNQYLDFLAPLGSASTVCVEMWARLKSDYAGGSTRMMFGWNSYDVWCTTSGIGFNSGSSDQYGITTSQVNSNALVNNWKHYVFEMNLGTQSGNKIYINGITQSLSKIFTNEPNTANMNFNSGLGRISGWRANTTYPAAMDLSLFRVYKRRLTSDEVFRNFDNSKRKYEILPSVVKNNLVLHLDADDTSSYDGSSAVWYDISGKGNNSNLFVNGPTFSKPSTLYPGRYLSLDGINDKIEFPSISTSNSGLDFYTDGNFSWEAWIYCKQDITNTNQMFMGVSGTPYFSFYSNNFYTNSNFSNYGNKILSNIQTDTGSQFYHFTNTTLSFEKWYHIVIVHSFNAALTKTTQRIYINGFEDQQDKVTNSSSFAITTFDSIPGKISNYRFNPAAANVGKLAIGDGAVSGEQFGGAAVFSPFKGNIAQVRLYRRALSAAEVKNNYNTSKHKFDLGNDTHGYNTHRLDTVGATNPTFSITQNLNLKVSTGTTFPSNINDRYNRVLAQSNQTETWWRVPDFLPKNQTNNTTYPDIFLGEANYGGIVVGRLSLDTDIIISSVRDIYYNNNALVGWGTNILVGGDSRHFGFFNTLNAAFDNGVPRTSTAAYICTQYDTEYLSSIETTWYLPSLYELMECYRHVKIINNILGDYETNTSHHGFFGGHYWTSTEYDASSAYFIDFSTGSIGTDLKTNLKRVRAVRTITDNVG